MVLLVGAGLMVNSYARATSVQMGLNPDRVLGRVSFSSGMDRYRTRFSGNHYAATPAVAQFYRQASNGSRLYPASNRSVSPVRFRPEAVSRFRFE